MKKTMQKLWRPFTLAAMTLLLALSSCSDSEDGDIIYMLPEKKDITLTEAQKVMRDNNNEFACRLFSTVTQSQQRPASTVLSPISVSYLLGMLNAGADGETRQEITDVLGLGGSVQDINEYCKKMIDEAPHVDPSATVKIVNCIDVNSAWGINLQQQYKADIQNYYNAQIDALDFTRDSSLDYINNWCSRNTDGMISSILDRLNPDAAMYLLNAIYFKATWTDQFDPSDTHEMDFTMPDGNIAKRQLMHRKAWALYAHNDLYSTLWLPYGSGGYNMFILLPNEGKTIRDVIQSLSPQCIEQDYRDMQTHEVDILIPRFTTSAETHLEAILSSMGMPTAFSPQADFSHMAQGCDNLFVTMMKQKAIIDVNEEGTQASAVTIAEMGYTSDGPIEYEQVNFHATRPFVYYIMEGSTRSIFFMGTYCGE